MAACFDNPPDKRFNFSRHAVIGSNGNTTPTGGLHQGGRFFNCLRASNTRRREHRHYASLCKRLIPITRSPDYWWSAQLLILATPAAESVVAAVSNV